MDWKTELEKKVQELNIKKEEENVRQSVPSTHISSGDNSRSSRDVHRVSIHKEIKNHSNIKGGERMITAEDALKDYEAICAEKIEAGEKLVKILKVVIKLLLNIRSNQRGGVPKGDKPPVRPTTK